ncbi:MFS transporter [Gordonia sp. i37]|uniref:MFS transporter n=1 Tax=Gordonia sp. i37 TaxID=1961707 RepID=UPI0009AEBE93|nr:MFS transporter [Gordonia sp. i37]OPX05659.1 hypothetical protein B1964_29220 [Gordonia sp. i37]
MSRETQLSRPPLRPFQIVVILMCTLLNALDGYDIFIMGFALPHLPDDFASDAMKGYLLSAALVGMGIGSIAFAPLADRYGRRLVLLQALALNAAGLTASALAPNYWTLIGSRLITGIAVGTIATVVVVLAPEVVPASWRSFAVGVVMLGYPLGSTIAGLASTGLLSAVGGSWQGMFWIGLVLCVIALGFTAMFMPESTAFLLSRGDPESKERASQILARLGMDKDSVLSEPTPAAPAEAPASKVRLLGRELRTTTLCLWALYGALSAAFYFVSSWTPKLVTDATSDKADGALAGLMVSLGTLAGAALYAAIGHRVIPARYAVTGSLIGALAMVGFALTLKGSAALILALLLGLTIYGAMAATVTSTLVYPVLARTRGMGSMIGVARVGAIVAPILAGYALSFASIRSLYLATVVLLVIAVIAATYLRRLSHAPTEARPSEPASPQPS